MVSHGWGGHRLSRGASRPMSRMSLPMPLLPARLARIGMAAMLVAVMAGGQIGVAQPASGALPKLELEGDFVQGGLVHGRVCPGCQVLMGGRPLPLTEQGRFIIGFGRDAPPEQSLRLCDQDRRQCRDQLLKVQPRDYLLQEITGVQQRHAGAPPAEELERIRAETRLVTRARLRLSRHTYFLEDFQWPLLGPVTGVFGSQRSYNGQLARPHYGIDIAAPMGAAVRSPVGGVVHPDMFYSGGTLVIDHGHGLSSTFLHLSRILVEEGQRVAQGELVAEVGSGGRSTGPHLDWRVNWRNRRLDPQLLVPPMPERAGEAPTGR